MVWNEAVEGEALVRDALGSCWPPKEEAALANCTLAFCTCVISMGKMAKGKRYLGEPDLRRFCCSRRVNICKWMIKMEKCRC